MKKISLYMYVEHFEYWNVFLCRYIFLSSPLFATAEQRRQPNPSMILCPGPNGTSPRGKRLDRLATAS